MPCLSLKSFLTFSVIFCIAGTAGAQDVSNLAKQKPFAINGTVGVGFGTYSVSGIPSRAKDFSYLLSGSPVISVFGVSFPLSVVVSDQQRSFTQPFNQYGVSPRYKWLTVHAGWRSLTFSPYTLAGYNFLGTGVEINPGKLRLGFMYGRFNKAIDANGNLSTSYFTQMPAYRRTGYAVKLGFGTDENHTDIIYFKAKDDTTSIKKVPSEYNITPAENATFGLSMKYKIFKHIFWEADVATSFYTRDLGADTFSSNTLKKVKIITSLIKINASSQFLTAGQLAVGYQGRNMAVRLQYKRVDPNYQSMGAYYFETDVESYTIAPSFFLFKHRLSFNASLGLQHDDILKDKALQSKKTIGNVSVGYNVTKFGFNIQYSNYGITQDRGLNPVIDTLRVARTNHNVNALLRFTLGKGDVLHNIIIAGNLQGLVDLNDKTASQSQTNSKTANISYQIGFTKAGINLSAIYNYTTVNASLINSVISGPSIGLDKQFARLTLSGYFCYQLQSNQNVSNGHYVSGTFSGSYKINKRNGLITTLNYLKSTSKDPATAAFNEFRTNLIYTYTF